MPYVSAYNSINMTRKFYEELNEKFELVVSNYATAIKIDKENARRYFERLQSNRCFAAFSKLKKDLKNKTVPNIGNKDVVYFQHDFKNNFKKDLIFSIDLKSAYANVLKSKGLISNDTFKYLSGLPKLDRLAAVGMLASRKSIYYYNGKDYKYKGDIVNPLAGFFFLAVKGTFEIMQELKSICGNKYLFTWVDCIYFQPDEDVMSECMFYLQSINFPFTPEVLTRFSTINNGQDIRVDYLKEGTRKTLHLPIKQGGTRVSKIDILV